MINRIEKVKTKPIDFKKYKKLTPKIFKESSILAKKIKGKKIIHLNSTQLGGGVSELLDSQTPLEQSLGLNSQWYIIKAPINFFRTTKKIHNLLQGKPGRLTIQEKNFYLEWLDRKIAPSFQRMLDKEKPDIVVIHDPQPLPLINHVSDEQKKKTDFILRMHIDLSEPNPSIVNFLQPFIEKYKLVIFSHSDYRPSWLPAKKAKIIMPALNPFTVKNRTIEKQEAERILNIFGLDVNRPIVSQVSRFDPWKDPLGVIKAYQIVKKEIPQLQLILAGISEAHDDPQAIEIFTKAHKETKKDPDVHLFFSSEKFKKISVDLFVNAVYTASTVVLQKSLMEGFGITVTEAMWKKKAVIGGRTSGIALQIKHGKNGFLVSSPEQAAEYLVKLLKNPSLRKKLGQEAHQSVRDNFLSSRFILDHLRIYTNI